MAGFARMIERAARRGLGLELKAHPHMLRHACGYVLANKGRDTRAIQGMAGASVDHVNGGLYGAGAEPVQGFLARAKPQGLGATAIAKALGIGRASVYQVL